MQDFTRLEVWRRATALAVDLDRAARRFSRPGYGWLASQLRRSSASIGANIAEGCGQHSQREFARFLRVAMASASETQHHVMFGIGIALLSGREAARLASEVTQVRRMLNALHRRVQESLAAEDRRPTAHSSQSS